MDTSFDANSDDNEAFLEARGNNNNNNNDSSELGGVARRKIAKRAKAMRMYSLDSQSRRSLCHLERDLLGAKGGELLSQSDLSKITNGVKTPKSALLERRRKAVFELLLLDRYPSGKCAVSLC